MSSEGRVIGTVKWFSGQKGFGFVAPEEGGEDLFVHQTEIQTEGFRTLREGQKVEFKVDREEGRSKAVHVVILQRSYNIPVGRGGRGGGGRGRGGVVGDVECYNCGGIGHLARDCSSEGRGRGGGRGRGRGGRGRGGGRGGGRECYSCGQEGHLARDCPAQQQQGN